MTQSVTIRCPGFHDRRTDDLKQRGDAIEERRLEAPKIISTKPVSCPIYRDTHIFDYGTWLQMNLQVLTDYWNALVTPDALGPLGEEDFHIFCLVQWDREQDYIKEMREAYMDRTEYTGLMGV
jgi:hypothetical protein